jgi:hypothetical protein
VINFAYRLDPGALTQPISQSARIFGPRGLLALGTQASFESQQRLVGEEPRRLYAIGCRTGQAVVFFREFGIDGTNHNHRLRK